MGWGKGPVEWGFGLVRDVKGGTDLLLRDIIELYPDLLLGRRWVMMRNEDGDDKRADTECKAYETVKHGGWVSTESLLLLLLCNV